MADLKVVHLEASKAPIKDAPGFAKKLLATRHLELMALCGFGCRYCSSNDGNFLRIRRGPFLAETKRQLGTGYLPAAEPTLHFDYPNIIGQLTAQLADKSKAWLSGEVLVVSQLTDAFSGTALQSGDTRRALELVLAKTSARIRILTKNAGIGFSASWRGFFAAHPDRFLVGLSVGTHDDAWSRRVEVNTPPPSRRLAAYAELQGAGISTYGMLCPVMPGQVTDKAIDRFLFAIYPDVAEEIFAEPYNDRNNWRTVRDGWAVGTAEHAWMNYAFDTADAALWSAYATDLLLMLRERAERDGWISKLRYLLYEGRITQADCDRIGRLDGILLQDSPDEATHRSRHPGFAALQAKAATPTK